MRFFLLIFLILVTKVHADQVYKCKCIQNNIFMNNKISRPNCENNYASIKIKVGWFKESITVNDGSIWLSSATNYEDAIFTEDSIIWNSCKGDDCLKKVHRNSIDFDRNGLFLKTTQHYPDSVTQKRYMCFDSK